MTTYAKFEQKHTDDERWIAAGADAFAVHVAAIVYCDRQLTDGRISDAMARRVSLAVPPERAPQAVAALVEQGFWHATDDDGYLIERFHEHAFPAEQVKRTQARWKADKDRRRQHSLGDHSLCKDPKFCPAIRDSSSTVESTVDGTVDSTRIDQTRQDQDQTRPEEGEGWSGNGKGTGGSDSSDGSAPLAASSPPPPEPWVPEVPGPPPGVVPAVNGIPVWGPGSDPYRPDPRKTQP